MTTRVGLAMPGRARQPAESAAQSASLADILERVLDKGIVIAGDIRVNLLDIELLTIKIRLLIASVDKAREIGIDWWERDPSLSSGRRGDLAGGEPAASRAGRALETRRTARRARTVRSLRGPVSRGARAMADMLVYLYAVGGPHCGRCFPSGCPEWAERPYACWSPTGSRRSSAPSTRCSSAWSRCGAIWRICPGWRPPLVPTTP